MKGYVFAVLQFVFCMIFGIEQEQSSLMSSINYYELMNLDISNVSGSFGKSKMVGFNAFGYNFTLLLELSSDFISDNIEFQNDNSHPLIQSLGSCHFIGKVNINSTELQTQTQSSVSMSLCNGRGMRGQFSINNETYHIYPAMYLLDTHYSNNNYHDLDDEHMIYRQTDCENEEKHCGNSDESNDQNNQFHNHQMNRKRRLQIFNYNIELEVVAGPEFYDSYSDYDNPTMRDLELYGDIYDLIFQTSGWYEEQDWGDSGRMRITLAQVTVWTSWSGREDYKPNNLEDANQALEAFTDYYILNANYDHSTFIAYAMWSRDTGGRTVGMAWINGICTSQWGSSVVTMKSNTIASAAQTMAHEVGHNLGMQHDSIRVENWNSVTDNTGCDGWSFIMAAMSDGRPISGFSDCSVQNMNDLFDSNALYSDCIDDNLNAISIREPECGNGVVENGEMCDCGCGIHSDIQHCCQCSTCQSVDDLLCPVCEHYECITINGVPTNINGHDLNGQYNFHECIEDQGTNRALYKMVDGSNEYFLHYSIWGYKQPTANSIANIGPYVWSIGTTKAVDVGWIGPPDWKVFAELYCVGELSTCDWNQVIQWDQVSVVNGVTLSFCEMPGCGSGSSPVVDPTKSPTNSPVQSNPIPTDTPTKPPTKEPTQQPASDPTAVINAPPPSIDSIEITEEPTNEFPWSSPEDTNATNATTNTPTVEPTKYPTQNPTKAPTKPPTVEPTEYPTQNPTKATTKPPTKSPTKKKKTKKKKKKKRKKKKKKKKKKT